MTQCNDNDTFMFQNSVKEQHNLYYAYHGSILTVFLYPEYPRHCNGLLDTKLSMDIWLDYHLFSYAHVVYASMVWHRFVKRIGFVIHILDHILSLS